jgi:hypothetical protein
LVLYDVQIQRGTILNIYHSYSFKEPAAGNLRFFYIDAKSKGIQKVISRFGELDFLKVTHRVTHFFVAN